MSVKIYKVLSIFVIFYFGYIEAYGTWDRSFFDAFSSLQDQLRNKRSRISNYDEINNYHDLLKSFIVGNTVAKRDESDSANADCKERSGIKYTGPNKARIDVRFPSVTIAKDDSYLCTAYKIPFENKESFIVKFTPHADMEQTHHMLVFGCESPGKKKPYWSCVEPCRGKQTIYAWARNAPELSLPKDVGYSIGPGSKINYIVVQMHFAKKFDEGSCAGVSAEVTTQPQKYYAGIFLLGAYTINLPPHSHDVPSTAVCRNPVSEPMHVFAFRTHAHNLANVITGYRVRDKKYEMIGKGNPKWPQSFYPRVGGEMILKPNDVLAARCMYNNSRDEYVHSGMAGSDEMCNLYLMFYTSDKNSLKGTLDCWGLPRGYKEKDVFLPEDYNDMPPYPGYAGEDSIQAIKEGTAVVPQVPDEHMHVHHGQRGHHEENEEGEHHNEEEQEKEEAVPDYEENPTAEKKNMEIASVSETLNEFTDLQKHVNSLATLSRSHGMPKYQGLQADLKYPDLPSGYKIGQVGGLVAGKDGSVHVFHRADRIWGIGSFDPTNHFTEPHNPINKDTIYHLTKDKGSIIHSWGGGQFFMPHGISLDSEENMWLTDVAMHQVFKYPPGGADEPLLTLGIRMKPGSDIQHFCKPTDVVVDSDGMVYVSDGYCNGRVMKFDKDGSFIQQWGRMITSKDMMYPPIPAFTFFVAHNIILCGPDQSELCVADRENGRIQCFTKNGKLTRIIKHDQMGSRVFAIAYSPLEGGVIYGVNGPDTTGKNSVEDGGFTLQYSTGQFIKRWQPSADVSLSSPHDITATPSGEHVYVGDLSGTKVFKFSQVPSAAPSGEDNVGMAFLSLPKKTEKPSEPAVDEDTKNEKNTDEKADDEQDEKAGTEQEKSDSKENPTNSEVLKDIEKEVEYHYDEENSSQAATIIIVILVVLPSIALIIAFACIRLRAKRLKEYESLLSSNGKSNKKLNLGKFLKPADRKGKFTRVDSVASDEDEDIDSDVEIYSKTEKEEEKLVQ